MTAAEQRLALPSAEAELLSLALDDGQWWWQRDNATRLVAAVMRCEHLPGHLRRGKHQLRELAAVVAAVAVVSAAV